MAAYVVLARKWRSSQFSDVVGQTHIVRTLMNAIRAGRLHQAYLFTGSRGIGKTSIARIFAKTIRCENVKTEGEWLYVCDQCSNCREITSSSSVDVIEIDGASNNGVEAVREIRENAKYLPATGTRKIYIIDEVHMLTTAAFNALLKTLEEPPPHVIFIFATTEPHKIPTTILSRCQRFDFRRINVSQTESHLAKIAEAEGIQAEGGALALIASAADGSMRDALSLLDQVISFSGTRITVDSTRESIGLIEGHALLGILNGIFRRKALDSIRLVDEAYQRGHDLRVLTRSLIEFLHEAILIKIDAPLTLLKLSKEEEQELREISTTRELEEIEMIFQVLHHGMEWVARSPQPKTVLDVLLVKCATAEALVFAEKTIARPTIATQAVEPHPANPQSWEGFIEHVRKPRPLLASILEHSSGFVIPSDSPADSKDPILKISYLPKDDYFREQLQSRVYHEQLLALSREYFGRTMRLQVEQVESGESLAAKKERTLREREKSLKETAENHPIILEAKSLFGGEMSPIQINEAALGNTSHATGA